MGYIRAVSPLKSCRLLMEMDSGSSVIVDLSIKLNTMKYRELSSEALFDSVVTNGDYVIWGGGRVKVTVSELMEIVLFGTNMDEV